MKATACRRAPWMGMMLAIVGLLVMNPSQVCGHGDTMGSATVIGLGSSVSGAIDWEGDEDWFSVQVTSSGTLTAYTTGSTDTYGYLVNSSGSTLASNDDDPYPNFRLSATVSAGTYYIRVRHFSSTGTGDYTLHTSWSSSGGTGGSTAEEGNSMETANPISVGSGYSAAIDYASDEDYFRLQVGASGTLTVYSTGNTDTYGYLLNSSGSILTYNDDDPYPNFRLSATVSAGTYYVRVRHYSSGGTGSYTLYTEFSGGGGSGGGGGGVSLGEALDQPGFHWTTYGHAPWFGQSWAYQAGGDAAQSGPMGSDSSSILEVTINGPGRLQFAWRVSSESGSDYLFFTVNGVYQDAISGETGWSTVTRNLPSGPQTLRWTYSKDSENSEGSDAGWVDDVLFEQVASGTASAETPDLLLRHPTYGLNAVWFMNNAQLQQSAYLLPDQTPDLDWNMVGLGDFNADGQKDIVWQHTSTGMVGVWFMNGRAKSGVGFTVPDRASDLGWKIAGVGDFNRDGKPDLLWQHRDTGDVAVWYMNGLTLTAGVYTNPPNPSYGWKIMGVGDFNRDQWPDILWQHQPYDYIAVWHMNGTSMQTSSYTSPYSPYDPAWDMVDTGDFNGDGFPDFLWQHLSTGQIAIWYMNNYTMNTSVLTTPSSPDPWTWQIQAVGDLDYAAAQLTDTDNDWIPDAWEQQYFGGLGRNGTGDFDGDGFVDLQEFRNGTSPLVESGLKVFTPLE